MESFSVNHRVIQSKKWVFVKKEVKSEKYVSSYTPFLCKKLYFKLPDLLSLNTRLELKLLTREILYIIDIRKLKFEVNVKFDLSCCIRSIITIKRKSSSKSRNTTNMKIHFHMLQRFTSLLAEK